MIWRNYVTVTLCIAARSPCSNLQQLRSISKHHFVCSDCSGGDIKTSPYQQFEKVLYTRGMPVVACIFSILLHDHRTRADSMHDWMYVNQFYTYKRGKVKASHTRFDTKRWAWSWSWCTGSQSTIHPAVGCHYFPPDLRLPSQPQSITALWPVPVS